MTLAVSGSLNPNQPTFFPFLDLHLSTADEFVSSILSQTYNATLLLRFFVFFFVFLFLFFFLFVFFFVVVVVVYSFFICCCSFFVVVVCI